MKILKKSLLMLLLIISITGLEFCHKNVIKQKVNKKELISKWKQMKGNIKAGKVIFAQPPNMYIFNLNTGNKKKIPKIIVEGGSGRRNRGLTPRPFWSKDGKYFIYRYKNKVYFADENGNKTNIINPKMKVGKETRWSLLWFEDKEWAIGPSKDKNVIMVQVKNNKNTRIIYSGKDVDNWCEVTGNGKFLVYDNGKDIYVTNSFSNRRGIKISSGQSCRPCASPNNNVGWLPSPHNKYKIHDGLTGKLLFDLKAPENEEIYRLNWSNHKNFAVHMFGSKNNQRINVRKISNGKSIFIGHGWDPDLWVGYNE